MFCYLLPRLLARLKNGNGPFFGFAVLATSQVIAVVLKLLPIPGLDGRGVALPWLPQKIAKFGQRY
jgi:Zn-dependent protease